MTADRETQAIAGVLGAIFLRQKRF